MTDAASGRLTSRGRDYFRPGHALERLMQAILLSPEAAKPALLEWQRLMNFDDMPFSHFRLMGELAAVIDRLAPDFSERKRLAGVEKFIWSNNIHILHIVQPSVERIAAAGIDFVVLKGGGVIASDPGALKRRFIRDIDLLVAENDVPEASAILMRAGWRPTTGRIPGRIRAQPFDRPIAGNQHGKERAEIDLHRSVVHFGRYGRFDDALCRRAVPGILMGLPVKCLNPVDRALVASMQGLVYDADQTHAWVLDAVRAMRTAGFDWNDFRRALCERRLHRHAALVLPWLERTFGVGCPPDFIANLGDGPTPWLYDAEIAAYARDRDRRGLSGRLAMGAAELVRSRRLAHKAKYRTDFIVRMKQVSAPSENPGGAEWQVRTADSDPASAMVYIRVEDVRPRLEFDLWRGDNWLARLRVDKGPGTVGAGWWGVSATFGPGADAWRITPV